MIYIEKEKQKTKQEKRKKKNKSYATVEWGLNPHSLKSHNASFIHSTNHPSHQQANSFSVSLEDIVKNLTTSTQAFQNETRYSIKNLEQQMSQLATFVCRLESQGKLPRHTENILKHNVSVISLRSGKSYENPRKSELKKEDVEESEQNLVNKEATEDKGTETLKPVKPTLKEYKSLPPFP
uniref:Uncharacterized protein n=1 Tax=Lactuca sativa TaxID=4236 RepID=A0A9R1VKM7_LACSA|nr:hypothetical protein LSAT_V11C500274310 [Lactuca sativa]